MRHEVRFKKREEVRKGSDEREGEDHTDDMSTDLEPKKQMFKGTKRPFPGPVYPC